MSAPIDDVARQPGEWLRGEGPLRDIVISTRIRLARNISGFPFLSRATGDQRVDIGTALKSAITKAPGLRDYVHLDIDALDDLDRMLLVERHLISRQHADGDGRVRSRFSAASNRR